MSDDKKKGGSPMVRGGAFTSWLGLTLLFSAPTAPWSWIPSAVTGKWVQHAGAPARVLAKTFGMSGALMTLLMQGAALAPLLLVALAPGIVKAKPFKIFFGVWALAYVGVCAWVAMKGGY